MRYVSTVTRNTCREFVIQAWFTWIATRVRSTVSNRNFNHREFRVTYDGFYPRPRSLARYNRGGVGSIMIGHSTYITWYTVNFISSSRLLAQLIVERGLSLQLVCPIGAEAESQVRVRPDEDEFRHVSRIGVRFVPLAEEEKE